MALGNKCISESHSFSQTIVFRESIPVPNYLTISIIQTTVIDASNLVFSSVLFFKHKCCNTVFCIKNHGKAKLNGHKLATGSGSLLYITCFWPIQRRSVFSYLQQMPEVRFFDNKLPGVYSTLTVFSFCIEACSNCLQYLEHLFGYNMPSSSVFLRIFACFLAGSASPKKSVGHKLQKFILHMFRGSIFYLPNFIWF